jgi:hypothetical protein
MNDQEFLHKLSVDTNVNIELLKDLSGNDKFWALVRIGKLHDAIMALRDIVPRVGLREAKMIAEAFIAQYK